MIGVVVVIHVAQQQAGFGFVHDQSNVEAHANRPEPWIFRLVELVELQSRMGRVLSGDRRPGLHGLLLVAGELGEGLSGTLLSLLNHLAVETPPYSWREAPYVLVHHDGFWRTRTISSPVLSSAADRQWKKYGKLGRDHPAQHRDC